MGLSVDCFDETGCLDTDMLELVRELLLVAARTESLYEDAEVAVTFVDNDKIRALNHKYRGKDEATDVISFALGNDDDEFDPSGVTVPKLLGDIVISVPKARSQADEYAHSFARELGFLAVHGFLHLLGYDHETKAAEKKMFARQKVILDEYGLQR